ncbi:MAG: glycosyltransferase [Methylococcales bacterium]|jgi:glycosyltransferase involved in cell wall biosynthesis|nr:glycosyltransferase [Methylococcales bacterium]MBT7445662.1 glycosyltransferase [Methylococcales bacterium]
MILFVLPVLSGGGAERVTLNLLSECHRQGIKAELLVFDLSGPLLPLIPDGVVVHNLKTISLRRSIVKLVQCIRKIRPQLVFSTLGYVNVALLAVRVFLPKYVKIWIREANLPSISLKNNRYSMLMTALYRRYYRQADILICTSKRMQHEFETDFKVQVKNIKILPNPVNVDKIEALKTPVVREQGEGVRFIAVGRLTYQKGFDRLLDWFAQMDEKAHLTIIGSGGLETSLKRQAEVLQVDRRVKWVSFTTNPWPYYAGADALLLSSRWEGMPNTVLETLVCGTKVIATAESGGVKELGVDPSLLAIVSAGDEFLSAMSQVIESTGNNKVNVLPSRYWLENVSSTFIDWLPREN